MKVQGKERNGQAMKWRRRELLKHSSSLLLGTSVIHASGRWARANDRIRVAVLGLGNRGRGHIREAMAIDGVEVATVCDPDETRMAKSAATLEKATGRRPRLEPDLRKIMEDPDIDVISIATPNHWHALATIWACQAGKHVYCEKPVAHNLLESRRMLEAAHKYDRIVATGTQRRSNPNFQKAVRMLQEGVIGEIYMARSEYAQPRDPIGFEKKGSSPTGLHWDLWLGPASNQPYHANLVHYNWHWFWDFGNGEIGNNGPHFLDIPRWALQKQLPTRIHSTGGRVGPRDQAQTPNTQRTTFVYEDGTSIVNDIRGLYTGEDFFWDFYGTRGYMRMTHSDRDFAGCEFKIFMGRNKIPEPDVNAPATGQREDHYRNFIASVRAGKPEMLNSDLEEGHFSGGLCLLANISYRLGRELNFDPAASRFVADSEADKLLTRNYRQPFVVPDRV